MVNKADADMTRAAQDLFENFSEVILREFEHTNLLLAVNFCQLVTDKLNLQERGKIQSFALANEPWQRLSDIVGILEFSDLYGNYKESDFDAMVERVQAMIAVKLEGKENPKLYKVTESDFKEPPRSQKIDTSLTMPTPEEEKNVHEVVERERNKDQDIEISLSGNRK